jgi:cytoskeletal protein CcmA (bactofilin family)
MSMFKKNEPLPASETNPQQPRFEARAEPAATPRAQRSGSGSVATIGPSVSIKGDVLGDEDLLVEGRVEGEIKVRSHTVTIGRSGSIKADVFAKSVRVEGEVIGNLYGEEEVTIRQTGKVEGNIVAPRVALEDGANFRGSIDMKSPAKNDKTQAIGAKTEMSQGAPKPATTVGAPGQGAAGRAH